MKVSNLIIKLVKILSAEGDVQVINIDCDGSIIYNIVKTESVDLGLPSGTKWSKCNYGAKTELDYGGYYTLNEAKQLPITLPTKEQIEELIKHTNCKWVENYRSSGINGRLFVSKINKNKIFIPAAGCRHNSSFNCVGSYGFVWSSSLYPSNFDDACSLDFDSGRVSSGYDSRYFGLSVRGVSK